MASPSASNANAASRTNGASGTHVARDPHKPPNPAAGSRPAVARGPATADQDAAPDPGFGFDHLLELFQEVISSREAMTVARRAPLGRSRLADAPRHRLLRALEAYTTELKSRNLPVPYGIRDDLRIQRRILDRVTDATG